MRYLPLICLITFALNVPAIAAVYKQVDGDGNVIFTDVPAKKGEEPVNVAPPAMTYTPIQSNIAAPAQSAKSKTQAAQYTSLSIVEPVNEAVIRANGGEIAVSVASEPKLDTDAKHRYVVLIDGTQTGAGSSSSFTVSGIDRGPHSLQAQILDEQNQVLVSSESINIQVLRHSILSH